MKKILALLILTFCFQDLALAGSLSLSGKSVTARSSARGVQSLGSISNGATFNQTTNASNTITSETICSADSNCVNFNGSNGSYTGTTKGGALRFFYNSNQVALQLVPSYFGWQYQSFGVWGNAVGSNGTASAGSFGSYTLGSSIPKTGSATYTGVMAGIVDNSGTKGFVSANMSAGTNFATRSINFATTNSLYSSTIDGTYTSQNALNLNGTLTYAANNNNFSGTVRNLGGGGVPVLTGTASGQFYGPAAQEIGGVIAMRSGSVGFIGGFGGKK